MVTRAVLMVFLLIFLAAAWAMVLTRNLLERQRELLSIFKHFSDRAICADCGLTWLSHLRIIATVPHDFDEALLIPLSFIPAWLRIYLRSPVRPASPPASRIPYDQQYARPLEGVTTMPAESVDSGLYGPNVKIVTHQPFVPVEQEQGEEREE